MKRFFSRVVILPLVVLFGLFGSVSCSMYSAAYYSGYTQVKATDNLLLVQETPPSLGFRRLKANQELYPVLKFFVEQRGKPDFVFETVVEGNRRFALSYIDKKETYWWELTGFVVPEFKLLGQEKIKPKTLAYMKATKDLTEG